MVDEDKSTCISTPKYCFWGRSRWNRGGRFNGMKMNLRLPASISISIQGRRRHCSYLNRNIFLRVQVLLVCLILFHNLPLWTKLSLSNSSTTLLVLADEVPNTNDVPDSDSGEEVEANVNVTHKPMEKDEHTEKIQDVIEDSFFDPVAPDPSCSSSTDSNDDDNKSDICWGPPGSTVETEYVKIDATALYGGDDPSEGCGEDDDDDVGTCSADGGKSVLVDKHWGSDEMILKMRDKLRNTGMGTPESIEENSKRPPVFLLPGLASTRLVSWRYKSCSNPLLSDVKVQDYVWMNINMLLQMATIDGSCFLECMTLGLNQSDMDDIDKGCKLRPDEGLDAISSLAPNSMGSNFLVGGKNTVYAWLTQWLADNLGYDVSSIIGLPYDWRLSPDVMERRDGFLTLTRRRIEAAVKHNGAPGIMVAHSMGNSVFRYFLEWLKNEFRIEAYDRLIKKTERREMAMLRAQQGNDVTSETPSGWISYEAPASKNPPPTTMDNSVGDQMYKLANSVVSSFDGMWQSYVKGSDEDPKLDEEKIKQRQKQLWELAQAEGDDLWLEWINDHVWTYIGLSAPLLGAINPLRAVLSGEDMGMPMTEKAAREMEISFGSTHTLNPISTTTGFCDNLEQSDDSKNDLACLDELIHGIEAKGGEDPWKNFPALRALLKERADWDSDFVPFVAKIETCEKSEKPPCSNNTEEHFSPKDVQSGTIFSRFNEIWKEKGSPLQIKKEQLQQSWWENDFPNLLNSTWDRPHIKHIVMSYGVDHPTEVGYRYKKTNVADKDKNENEFDDIPLLTKVLWEEAHNYHFEEVRVSDEPKTLSESVMRKKKPKRRKFNDGKQGTLHRSGDASVPYLSLSWAHTWLLHATRATRHSQYFGMKEGDRMSDDNALDSIRFSYRSIGGRDWIEGGLAASEREIEEGKNKMDEEEKSDTLDHPHGTKYKPEMFRYQSRGKSRTTGMEYTTAVIEAVGVEHKETTRNYDILAAVFTDVLKNMHDDLGLV